MEIGATVSLSIRMCSEMALLEMDMSKEVEKERIRHKNSILNSYKEKVRENQHSQEHNQSIQNLHDESNRRMAENDIRTRDISKYNKQRVYKK